MGMLESNRAKIAALAAMIGVISLLHFLIPVEPHSLHKIHIVLRKLYFLPPVIAAVWFGLRGAFLSTTAISIFFVIHTVVDWPGNYMEQANQAGEFVSFWAVGLISGWLFDRERALLKEIAKANEETLLGLVSALDMRERNTRLHSQRVREYSLLLADQLGIDEKARRVLGFGALLHDVGKIAVSDLILMKPGNLVEEEWKEVRKHPEAGYLALRHITFLREAVEIVYAHHEYYDGSGYPRGLKGEEIPLGARIFMAADVYDALTSVRPYHSPLSHEKALDLIREKSGSHFDPDIVRVFLKIDPKELEAVRKEYQDGSETVEKFS